MCTARCRPDIPFISPHRCAMLAIPRGTRTRLLRPSRHLLSSLFVRESLLPSPSRAAPTGCLLAVCTTKRQMACDTLSRSSIVNLSRQLYLHSLAGTIIHPRKSSDFLKTSNHRRHQSQLVLCQRYAAHPTLEQKDALRDVVWTHPHPQLPTLSKPSRTNHGDRANSKIQASRCHGH
jgi:hypothetical protein